MIEYAKQREQELSHEVRYCENQRTPGRAQALRNKRSAFRELIAQFDVASAYWLRGEHVSMRTGSIYFRRARHEH